ncbi:MAG: hypothetical protein QOF76_4928, partial [Solirubrobacteraceae bacterium]|nr:hypothetical protein [Solirubrobacteraceae bacterium]
MGAARTPIALVEREVELARIAGRLAQSRSGEGALIVVDGPAGIGKTSLLRALGGQAAADGMQVLHARGSELETGFAFGVLRMALAPALAALDPAARTEVTAGQAAHALAMLEPGDADGAPEAVLHGVYWLIANLAEYGPLVLLVDDAQWADSPSIDGLSFLARRVEQLPVALVVATRPPDPDVSPVLAALAADPSAEVLRPMPLGDWGIAELAGTADADFVAAAAAATGGNPFLVDQLLRELGPERTPRAVAAVDPRHLARVVLARVSDDARALARALAVIGDGAGLRECGALGCVADAEAAAGELARAGLIGEDELRFRHPLLAAAVEADLGGVRRSAWHGRAAAALHATGAEPERIALHLTKTEPAGNAESARTLWRAAGAARARGAPTTAAGLLRRALLEPPAAEERVAVSL